MKQNITQIEHEKWVEESVIDSDQGLKDTSLLLDTDTEDSLTIKRKKAMKVIFGKKAELSTMKQYNKKFVEIKVRNIGSYEIDELRWNNFEILKVKPSLGGWLVLVLQKKKEGTYPCGRKEGGWKDPDDSEVGLVQ